MGWSTKEALEMNIRDLIPETQREVVIFALRQRSQAEIMKPFRTQRITRNGTVVNVRVTATALLNEAGQVYAIITMERLEATE